MYLGSLILGGGLLVASAVLGGGDGDADVDHDIDHDIDHDVDHDVDHADVGSALWLPILSLRFWTFFLAFFGLTGAILDLLGRAGAVGASTGGVLAISLVTGFGAGWGIATLVRRLKADTVSSTIVPETDYAGRAGEVILDVAPGSPGWVRVEVRGVSVDLKAELVPGHEAPLTAGQQVIVVAWRDGRVIVGPFDTGERGQGEGDPGERAPEGEARARA